MKTLLSMAGYTLAIGLLLGGCYMAEPADPRLRSPEKPVAKQEDIQRDTERDMVILFQSLLQLDKQNGLGITGRQAKEMLPVVKRNSSEGELAREDRQRIVIILTAEQKRFVAEYRDQMCKMRQVTDMEVVDEFSPEERERMIREFQAKRRLEREDERGLRPGIEEADEPDDFAEMDVHAAKNAVLNVEQRLIRLLEDKTARLSE